jgi:putative transposase
MQTRKPYDTDLTDDQWSLIEGFFPGAPPPSAPGRRREYPYRDIVNAILYLGRTGCQWRNLPHDFPPYTLVSHYYHLWRKNGLLERIHDALRAKVRKQAGRDPEPSVLLVDSQSVKTTEKGGRRNLSKLSVLTWARRSKAANAISR